MKTLIASLLLIIGLPVLLTPTVNAAAVQRLTLTAGDSAVQFPYFDTPTATWGYNGRSPGPTIRVRAGDRLEIDFVNALSQPSTIHWHGLRIDNAMDGVPGVTQPPVASGSRFHYRLTPTDAGIFWYHPHLNGAEQLERGLKGVLIVEERNPLPWSRELVLLLDDWRLLRDGRIFPRFNTHHDLMHDGRWGNAVTVNGAVRPVFEARPGERIRLRLVNGANARVFMPSFGGLAPRLIAVDGRPVSRRLSYDDFALSPGNRLDLDITIPRDAGGNRYEIADQFTRQVVTLATIRVAAGAPVATPAFDVPMLPDFLPASDFVGLPVTRTWDLNAIRGGQYGIGWAINRQLWPETDGTELRLGRPQIIRMVNSSTRLHPMHIHGVFFRVLSRNGDASPEPFTRDTVLVGPRESVTIGLVPTHKGVWVAHCHIQSHAEAGMMTAVEIDGGRPVPTAR